MNKLQERQRLKEEYPDNKLNDEAELAHLLQEATKKSQAEGRPLLPVDDEVYIDPDDFST